MAEDKYTLRIIVESSRYILDRVSSSGLRTFGDLRAQILRKHGENIRRFGEMKAKETVVEDSESLSDYFNENQEGKLVCNIELIIDPIISPPAGIDLGTYATKVFVNNGKQPFCLSFNSQQSLRSCIKLDKTRLASKEKVFERCTVGGILKDPDSVNIEDSKRIIGRNLHEATVQEQLQVLGYSVVPSPTGQARIRLITDPQTGDFVDIAPQCVAAEILKKVKQVYLNHYRKATKMRAVITVPADFSEAQRSATLEAAEIAGIDVIQLVSEPTAAAIACMQELRIQGADIADGRYMVVDMGGGTFDVSLIESRNEGRNLKVIDTQGDIFLGGRDIDKLIYDHYIETIERELTVGLDPNRYGIATNEAIVKGIRSALQQLKAEATECKVQLTTEDSYDLNIQEIRYLYENDKHGSITISREQLNSMIEKSEIPKKMEKLLNAIDRQGLKKVFLVGGSCEVPFIRDWIVKYFNGDDNFVYSDSNIQMLVPKGAAHLAYHMDYEESTFQSITDIVSKSLGVELVGDAISVLLEKGRNLPATNAGTYGTCQDYQTSVIVSVKQGESPVASKNQTITDIIMDGIEPLPKGEAKVRIAYTLNTSGILEVTVIDLQDETRIIQRKVTLSSRLSEDQLARLTAGEVNVDVDTPVSLLMKQLAKIIYQKRHKALNTRGNRATEIPRVQKLKALEAYAHNFQANDSATEGLLKRKIQEANYL